MHAFFAESNVNSEIETSFIIYAYSKLVFIGLCFQDSLMYFACSIDKYLGSLKIPD